MFSDNAVSVRIEVLLRGAKPAAYCDPCLASALALPQEAVASAAGALARMSAVTRKVGRCTPCRSTKRVVMRAMM
jgi:hypothetical protein